MSAERPTNPPTNANHAAVHEQLVTGFTQRYIARQGLGAIAYAKPYDPTDTVSDYDRTYWNAEPANISAPLATLVLGKMHRLSKQEVRDDFVAPFADRSDTLSQALQEFPVMLINGHHLDLQAALTLFAAGRGVAAQQPGNKRANYHAMARLSHGIVTRGIAPIGIGRPNMPIVSFVRLCRLVVNPHMSFPNTSQMRESGIDGNFIKAYNERLKREAIACATQPPDPVSGYNQLWSLAPAGEPDVAGKDEHEGKTITKTVKPGTLDLIRQMGCGLLPVYTKLGKGKEPSTMQLGDIIRPEEVTSSAVHTIMSDLAGFRRQHGQNAFYEAEL